MRRGHRLVPAVATGALLVACATTDDGDRSAPDRRDGATASSDTNDGTTNAFRGVRYRVFERAADDDHPLVAGKRQVVDANSDLIVTFELDRATVAGKPSEEWARTNALLDAFKSAGDEYVAINAQPVVLTDADAAAKLRDRVRAHDDAVVDAMTALTAMLQPEFGDDRRALGRRRTEITSGRFDRQPEDDRYANIARYLRQELERLQREIDEIVAKRKLVVGVQAFLVPQGGQLRQLHVENYDSIPAGEYAPIDRYGLDLTEAERKDLTMKIEQAELAADAVREIVENKGEVGELLKSTLDKLKAQAESFADQVEEVAKAGPRAALTTSVTALRSEAAKPERAAQKSGLEALADGLEAFGEDLQSIEALIRDVRAIEAPAAGSPLQLLDAVSRLTSDLAERVATLGSRIASWPERVGTITTALGDLVDDRLTAESLLELVPQPVRDLVDGLEAEQLSKTFELVVALVGAAGSARANANAIDELEGADDRLITRRLDDLQPGRVELPRAGLVLDDRVELRIVFYALDENDQRGEALHSERYDATATLVGGHRRLGAQLIFERASTGTNNAKSWSPNAAVTADWHYRIRDPEGTWEEGWNAIDPGFGIHAASLDHGDDSVELGVGVNVSLFGGLVVGGYGWNLSVDDDRDYYFLGLDLFDLVLDSSKVGIGAR